MGAWIEINVLTNLIGGINVAPLVGAWIEINGFEFEIYCGTESLLSWERGLKYNILFGVCRLVGVAPLVGAWIEIVKWFLNS